MVTATALADAERWRRSAKTWGVLAILYAITACCVPVVLVVWNGCRVVDQTVDELCDAVRAGPNRPAAVEEARNRALRLVRAIAEAEHDDGRAGLAARTALEQIRREVSR